MDSPSFSRYCLLMINMLIYAEFVEGPIVRCHSDGINIALSAVVIREISTKKSHKKCFILLGYCRFKNHYLINDVTVIQKF